VGAIAARVKPVAPSSRPLFRLPGRGFARARAAGAGAV